MDGESWTVNRGRSVNRGFKLMEVEGKIFVFVCLCTTLSDQAGLGVTQGLGKILIQKSALGLCPTSKIPCVGQRNR